MKFVIDNTSNNEEHVLSIIKFFRSHTLLEYFTPVLPQAPSYFEVKPLIKCSVDI